MIFNDNLVADNSPSATQNPKATYKNSATSLSSRGSRPVFAWPESTLSNVFNELVAAWSKETRYTNSMNDILQNRNLLSIISLGKDVIPLIFKDLQSSPKHWFHALHVLTGADPVKTEHSGNLQKMRIDWINWGKQNGYILN